MKHAAAIALVALLLGAAILQSRASGASENVREDPLEGSVREIAQQLRCPVCQGETLYDSQSSLAAEMRAIIREQLAANRSEPEIIAYFVDRYGDYVRLAPSWNGGHVVIWLVPLLAFVAGVTGVSLAIRRRHKASGTQEGR